MEAAEATVATEATEAIDGAIYPLDSEWTWYAHTDGNAAYGNSVVTLGSFDTVNDFWRHYNHVPTPGRVFCGEHTLVLPKAFNVGCAVSGFAVFRKGVHPAWEDPRNARGCDLCARATFRTDALDAIWRDLLLALIGEELGANVVGIRTAFKRDRRTALVTHKIEIWCDDKETAPLQRALASRFPSLHFTVVAHEEVAASYNGRQAGGGRYRPAARERRHGGGRM